MSLAAFWLGGEASLIFAAFLVPLLYSATGLFTISRNVRCNGATGLPVRTHGELRADTLLSAPDAHLSRIAVLALGVDDFDDLVDRMGARARDEILAQVAARLASEVREDDLVVQLSEQDFGIVLSPMRHADLEALIHLSGRVQICLSEPFSIGGTRLYITASIGFCTAENSPSKAGSALIRAAEHALEDARAQGPGSIRAYSPGMTLRKNNPHALAGDVEAALLNGQILPWFQPQIRTDTGTVSGVEALARWSDPARGLVPTTQFLPLVEEAGLSQRLSERILQGSLAALQAWDREGLHVPRIGVNFATGELRNPHLVEKVRWELDRFDLAPERLTIEVLETVIASTADDTVVRNLWELSQLGCGIDLDDFGTGHAAIGNIRRFSIKRVKIDQSFVTRLDSDPEQQNMVSAIVLMAERLGLDTLAEGVETASEHGTLTRLGCRHVQGYGIARPMPEAAMRTWLRERGNSTDSSASPAPPAIVTSGHPSAGNSGKTA